MGKISFKRRDAVEERLQAATAKWGGRVFVSLDEQRETLAIFVVRPDDACRRFEAGSRPSQIGMIERAAKTFARPN